MPVLAAVSVDEESEEVVLVGTIMIVDGTKVVAESVPVGAMLTIGAVGFSVTVGVGASTTVDEVGSSVDVVSGTVDTGVTLGEGVTTALLLMTGVEEPAAGVMGVFEGETGVLAPVGMTPKGGTMP